jgi:polyhydroxyalkanoate synthase
MSALSVKELAMAQQPCSVPVRAADPSEARKMHAREKRGAQAPDVPACTTAAPPPPAPGSDTQAPGPALDLAEVIDRSLNYGVSRLTLGLSPAAIVQAYFDWAIHLAASPGKQLQLLQSAGSKWLRIGRMACTCALQEGAAACIEPLPNDRRFSGPAWKAWPFNIVYQAFLLQQQWWHEATTGVRGVTGQHEHQVDFATRQVLDVVSPTNFLPTNPEVLHKTRADAGMNLVRGFWNFVEDAGRTWNADKPVGADAFKVGENIAVTPGKVIFRNELIELIQYEPSCAQVRPEPVLIVPAWIMKYYILDLSRENSLVRYLTEQGFTVFMISWKNAGPAERNLGLEDYRRLGVIAALDVVRSVVPEQKVHATGYCLGGTLLATAAAALARNGADPLATVTLLAGQVDFKQAGELTLFITESQVAFLEDVMREQGFLDAHQMAGAFQLLRSNDLIWSRMVRDYLMGTRRPMSDMMAWNADTTRMPYRMHSEYLRRLFLDNDLAEGRYRVDGRHIAISDIRAPIFAVGTEQDHVAPWLSVYKLHLLADTEITFVLASGGHNAGIVPPPGVSGLHYRMRAKSDLESYVDPATWLAETPERTGSWWPAWAEWLKGHSGGPVPAVPVGNAAYPALAAAPGSYVLAA